MASWWSGRGTGRCDRVRQSATGATARRGRGAWTPPGRCSGLAGAVALLLWGVHMVQTGIQRAYGPDLRRLLGTALNRRLAAFLAGLGVTAVLQSSTATGLMVTGFAAGGAVALVPALAVMLRANVGTTLIVQILSFDVAAIAPALILIGVLLFLAPAPRAHATWGASRSASGLMLMAAAPAGRHHLAVRGHHQPAHVELGAITTQPVLDELVAAALTWAAHSSVAVVLLVMSLATKGGCRRMPRSRWCSAPISAPRSTR